MIELIRSVLYAYMMTSMVVWLIIYFSGKLDIDKILDALNEKNIVIYYVIILGMIIPMELIDMIEMFRKGV